MAGHTVKRIALTAAEGKKSEIAALIRLYRKAHSQNNKSKRFDAELDDAIKEFNRRHHGSHNDKKMTRKEVAHLAKKH